jgi:hypothetical protein
LVQCPIDRGQDGTEHCKRYVCAKDAVVRDGKR